MKKIGNLLAASLMLAGAGALVPSAATPDSEAQAEIAAKIADEQARAISLLYRSEEGEEKPWYIPDFTWSDANVNYLAWSSGSKRRNPYIDDFWYVELEGGAGWEWGDFYFFSDLENPGKGFNADDAPKESRWVIKPVLDINLPGLKEGWLKNLQIHIQDYYLYGETFLVNNFVAGLAYKYVSENFFARPFVGLHYMHDTFNETLFDGYMGGWVFNYDIRAFGAKFALSNWHEFEWDRDRATYRLDDGTRIGDGASWGLQGALAGWWHATKHLSAGVQYRYSWHKLGSYDYLTATIFTLKYNF
ncbi:outer membrane protein OmpK [Hydrogenimonas sp.]